MAITKAALSEHLAVAMAFDKPTATLLVEQFFEQVAAALIKGEAVKISGLGIFSLYHRAPRLVRNPKTGQPACVNARRVVAFKAGRKLRERVKEGPSLEDGEE